MAHHCPYHSWSCCEDSGGKTPTIPRHTRPWFAHIDRYSHVYAGAANPFALDLAPPVYHFLLKSNTISQ